MGAAQKADEGQTGAGSIFLSVEKVGCSEVAGHSPETKNPANLAGFFVFAPETVSTQAHKAD